MKLNEMLIYSDINDIKNIVDNYKCECNRHSKTDMIEMVIYTLSRKDIIEEEINNLDDVEYLLIILIFLNWRRSYTIEELLTKAKQSIDLYNSDRIPKELIMDIINKGWVIKETKKEYFLVYVIPEDIIDIILEILQKRIVKKIDVVDSNDSYYDESGLIGVDLTIFLNFVLKEDVLLTGEGNIYKRQQYNLLNSLLIKEISIVNKGWRFGYGRRYNEYPDRFSLIYDYAFYKKLIIEDEDKHLYITPLGGKWLQLINYDIEFDIFYFWLKLYKHTIKNIKLIVNIIDLIAYNCWVNLTNLQEELSLLVENHFYESKIEVFNERIIKMSLHLGFIQFSSYNNNNYIRVVDKGHKWIKLIDDIENKELKY